MNKITICKFLILLSLILLEISLNAQEWELKKEKDGVKVYLKEIEGKSIKLYKANVVLDFPITAVYQLITDYENYPQWVDVMSEVKILDYQEYKSYTYYAVMNMPWPFWDRDITAQVVINQKDSLISFKSKPVAGIKPEQEGKVRLSDYWESYELVKISDNQTLLNMEGMADMGGSIPAWVINLFMVDGPVGSINSMRKVLKQKSLKN